MRKLLVIEHCYDCPYASAGEAGSYHCGHDSSIGIADTDEARRFGVWIGAGSDIPSFCPLDDTDMPSNR